LRGLADDFAVGAHQSGGDGLLRAGAAEEKAALDEELIGAASGEETPHPNPLPP
jgi:hypothetical protein